MIVRKENYAEIALSLSSPQPLTLVKGSVIAYVGSFRRKYKIFRLLYKGYRVFPGGKERPGRDSDPSPPSSAVVMKG